MSISAPCTGLRMLDCNDPVQCAALPLAVLYPALGQPRIEHFGPYSVELARAAPPLTQRCPLIVFSHGNGSTPWAYRDLALSLVQAGYMVALPEHTGNSRNDNTLAGTAANLANRPRHVSLVIDAVLADPVLRAVADAARIGMLGHSIGAYTALAVAGGKPWAAPHETPDRQPHPVPVTADPRVRALALLAPAAFWFPPGALQAVRIPLLLRSGAQDTITPPAHAITICDGVADPALAEHATIPGAGHFAFLSVFPADMIRPDFAPSQDPPGFRRESIQPALFADIAAFFARTL